MDIQTVLDWILRILGGLTLLAGIAAGIAAYVFREWIQNRLQDWFQRRSIKLTHELQIVQDMAKTFHEYSLNSYMPVVRAAKQLDEKLSKADREISFYRLVIYLRHYRQTYKPKFLKDIAPEVLLASLEDKITDLLVGKNRLLTLTEATLLEQGDPAERFEEFEGRLESSGRRTLLALWPSSLGVRKNHLRETFEKYKAWVETNAKTLQTWLRCWYMVMLYEINEGHKAWYENNNPVKLQEDQVRLIADVLDKMQTDPSCPLNKTELDKLRSRYPQRTQAQSGG